MSSVKPVMAQADAAVEGGSAAAHPVRVHPSPALGALLAKEHRQTTPDIAEGDPATGLAQRLARAGEHQQGPVGLAFGRSKIGPSHDF